MMDLAPADLRLRSSMRSTLDLAGTRSTGWQAGCWPNPLGFGRPVRSQS